MEKKQYSSPAMRVVKIQVRRQMLSGSVRGMNSGDAGVGYGGASSKNDGGQVRSNGHRGIWDGME